MLYSLDGKVRNANNINRADLRFLFLSINSTPVNNKFIIVNAVLTV